MFDTLTIMAGLCYKPSRIYKRPESVLIVIYTLNADVLLLKRKRPGGFWQSVTGSLEQNETPLQAACRELCEETGLNPRGIKDCRQAHSFEIYPIFYHRYAPGVTHNLEHVFRLCVATRCEITLDKSEHITYTWLSKHEAVARVCSHTNKTAIIEWVPELG